jgi:GntR family transcriptional regulator, rspAB operon transcriptional repressor
MAELLRDRVYQVIRKAILTCEFMPGQELREQVLAEKYRVSRSPIRDSLLRLEQESLVTVLPRCGYRVNPISIRDVQDVSGLRRYVEPACAAAAARASDIAVRTLDQFRDFIGEETYDGANLDYNRDLHRAIADLAGNSRLAAVEYALIEEFNRLLRLRFRPKDEVDVASSVRQHHAIIDAIQAHDAEAAHQLSLEHLTYGQAMVIEPLTVAEGPKGYAEICDTANDSVRHAAESPDSSS